MNLEHQLIHHSFAALNKVYHRKLYGSVKLLFMDFDPRSHKKLPSFNISYFQYVPNSLLLPSTKQSTSQSYYLLNTK